VLYDLFNAKLGYAFPTDSHLSKLTGLALDKLQSTLTILDRGGAIIRCHVEMPDGRTQRRIYPSAALIPAETGGADTPRLPGGQNLKRSPRIMKSQLALARAAAMIRDGDG
jgi:hypothetical protein